MGDLELESLGNPGSYYENRGVAAGGKKLEFEQAIWRKLTENLHFSQES